MTMHDLPVYLMIASFVFASLESGGLSLLCMGGSLWLYANPL